MGLGCLLAVLAGLATSAAAALEKRESVLVGPSRQGFRLLAALVRRPWWVAATAGSVVAWAGEAAGLALAPVTVVAPLVRSGRALLVLVGIRWLGERYGGWELLGVGLALGGALGAGVSAGASGVDRAPQPVALLVLIGAAALAGSAALAASRTGPAYGAGAGLLHAATGVFTKEIGDAVARGGLASLLTASPVASLVGMIALSAVAEAYVQTAFQRSNAATVSSASAASAMTGLLLAGFVLYHESFPSGWGGVLLVASLGACLLGALLLGAHSGSGAAAPAPPAPPASPAAPGS